MIKQTNGANKSRAIAKRTLEAQVIRGITRNPQPTDTRRETILRIALERIGAMEVIDGAIAREAKAIAHAALNQAFHGVRSYPRCPRKYRPDGSHLFDHDGICACGFTLQKAIEWADRVAAIETLDSGKNGRKRPRLRRARI